MIDSYTKEKRKIYNSFYKKSIKGGKKRRNTQNIIQYQIISHPKFTPEPLTGSFKNCSTFGCSNILSLRETLFGTKCVNCQQKGTGFDVTNVIFKK